MEKASLQVVVERMFNGFSDDFVAEVVQSIKEEAQKAGIEPLELLRNSPTYLKPMIFDVTGLTEPEPA